MAEVVAEVWVDAGLKDKAGIRRIQKHEMDDTVKKTVVSKL